MSIRLPFPGKSVAQSLIPAASRGLVWQNTDVLLSAAGAYISGLRGLGWSPPLRQEAITAAHWVDIGNDFVVIDAGANIGSWTATFRKHVTRPGKIYAFEPQPQAASKIRDLHVDGCEVIEMALGKQSGRLAFYAEGSADTLGSIYERRDTYVTNKQQARFEVNVIRLDDFVETNRIRRIDFLKMDLEGAEFEALNGATECMRSGLVRAISFEFGISNVNARVFFRDIFQLLSERHYQVFRMTPAGRLIGVKEYSEDLEVFARTTTYFARHVK